MLAILGFIVMAGVGIAFFAINIILNEKAERENRESHIVRWKPVPRPQEEKKTEKEDSKK